MADEASPLSDDERAELETLRREAAARQQAEQAALDRQELERLRSQAAEHAKDLEEAQRLRELKEQRRELVEPDENYRMPPMQKLVFVILAIVVLLFVLSTCGPH